MSNKQTKAAPRKGLGISVLILLIGLLLFGFGVLVVLNGLGQLWAKDGLAGWMLGGVLGLTGFWSYRKALSGSDQNQFLKYMVGGMLLRLLLCGLGAGLLLGTGWFQSEGLVVGLLVGIAVFLGVEIVALQRWARNQDDLSRTQSIEEPKGASSGS